MMLHSVSRMIYSWMLEIPGTSRCPTSFDIFFGGVEVPSDGTEVVKDSQMVEGCGALHLGSEEGALTVAIPCDYGWELVGATFMSFPSI